MGGFLLSKAVKDHGLQCGTGVAERQLHVPVRPHPCCCYEDWQDVCGRERRGGVYEALPRVCPAVRPLLSTLLHHLSKDPAGMTPETCGVLCMLPFHGCRENALGERQPACAGMAWGGDDRTARFCRYCSGDHPPQPRRDIKSFWLNYCEDEWQRAFFMFSASERPRLCCKSLRHMQRTCSCQGCCAGHFQDCKILADV